MATIDYPANLRISLSSAHSRETPSQAIEVPVSAGTTYYARTTFDLPARWTQQFRFHRDDAMIFEQWLRDDLEGGVLAFNMPIVIEAGLTTQEVYFESGGVPQLTNVDGNVYTYSATVIADSINDPDDGRYTDLLYWSGQAPSGSGDPNEALSLFDIIINRKWPSVSPSQFDITINLTWPEA